MYIYIEREREREREKPKEQWWNASIKTATKVPHNKPDLITWLHGTVKQKSVWLSNEAALVYAPLVRNWQIMHPGYKVVGAMGMFQNV